MRPFKLSRRAVLRGGGVSIALPTLDAMLTDGGLFHGSAQAQPSAPPVRMVTFFLPNGFPQGGRFVPTSTGAGYKLTPCLEPLKDHVADFTVLSGIGAPPRVSGNTHSDGMTGFTTGLGARLTGATGPSVDYVASKRRGQGSQFPMLSVGVQRDPMPNTNGFSYDIFRNCSWQGANQVIPAEFDPNALFKRLFGSGAPIQDSASLEQVRRDRKSVLDFVGNRIERLEAKVGAEDRLRLEAHLTGVRELERRLPLEAHTPAGACAVPTMRATPSGHFAKAQLMVDLVAMALQCNLTNYVGFIYGIGAGDGGRDSSLGLTSHQHQIVHAGNQEMMQRFTVAQMKVFARFIERLKAAREGGQSVLYNSVVLLGTELGNGTSHNGNNLPFVLAGHAGGRLKSHGRHIAVSGARVGRVLLTLLRLAGIDEPSFANETSPLSQLMG
jgi:hypothetical protein